MAQPYEVIFFDMDGTLFDLAACERETVRGLLAQIVPSLGPVEIEDFLTAYAAISPGHWAKGLAVDASREAIVGNIFSDAQSRLGSTLPDLPGIVPLYWRLFGDVAVLEAGVVETLDTLAANYRLGVIGNGYEDTQRPRLHAANLTGYFETIVVSGEVGWVKPDPRIFAYALEEVDVDPGAAFYVGDSISHDLAGALGAGLDFCLYRPKGGAGLELPPGVRLVTALSQLAGLLA
jgi:FMN phosphatase YigB (HAD superfamily)